MLMNCLLNENKVKTHNRKYEWIKISKTLELPTDISTIIVKYIK